MDTATVQVSTKFYKTTFPADMIFKKEGVSNSDEKVEKLTWEFNIHYKACIGSLIYLFSTGVDLSFSVHKLATFSANPGKVNIRGLVLGDLLIKFLPYFSKTQLSLPRGKTI